MDKRKQTYSLNDVRNLVKKGSCKLTEGATKSSHSLGFTTTEAKEFVYNLENKDFFEMIYLLDKEATEAERRLFNPKSSIAERQRCGPRYINSLKSFIFYLRYGARPKGLKQEDIGLFDTICEKNRIWEVH